MWVVVYLDTSTIQLQKCPTAAVRHCLVYFLLYWWMMICPTGGDLPVCWSCYHQLMGEGGVDVRRISQALSRRWMVPSLFFSRGEWQTTLVSYCLMNIKCQARVSVCVFMCRDQIVKLFVIIGVLLFIVPTHVRTATHTLRASTHTHVLPATHWADAVLSCFIALLLSLPPSPVTQDRDPSCHRHQYE